MMCESVRIARERIAEYMQHHAIITVHKDNTPSVIHATLDTPALLKLVNRSRQKDNIISRIPLQLPDTVLLLLPDVTFRALGAGNPKEEDEVVVEEVPPKALWEVMPLDSEDDIVGSN